MKRSRLEILYYLACAPLVLIGLLRVAERTIRGYLNSDLLYIAGFYQDLFVDRIGVGGWNLPPAPYFVPDMLLFFPLLGATGRLGLAYLLYDVVLFCLFATALWLILGQVSAAPRRGARVLAGALLWLVAAVQAAPLGVCAFFVPIFHGGAIVMGLLCLALFLSARRGGYGIGTGGALLLLVTLSALSDLLFVFQFVIPLLLAALIGHRRGWVSWRCLAMTWALCAGGGLLLVVAVKLLHRLTAMDFVGNPVLMSVDRLLSPLPIAGLLAGALLVTLARRRLRTLGALLGAAGCLLVLARWQRIGPALRAAPGLLAELPPGWPLGNLGRFAGDIGQLAWHNPALWACAFLAPALGLLYLWRAPATAAGAPARGDDRGAALACVVLTLLLSGLVSVLWAGLSWIGVGNHHYTSLPIFEVDSIRHMQPAYVLSIFLLAFLADAWHRRIGDLRLAAGLALVAGFAALRILPGAGAELAGGASLPYPEEIRCFDDLVSSAGLHAGYGDFWASRHLTLIGRAGAQLNQLTLAPSGEYTLERWVNNPAGYVHGRGAARDRYPRYDFVIFGRIAPIYIINQDYIERRFGPPALRRDCRDLKIWVYDRPGDVAFRSFIRVPALIAAGRALPSSVASHPALNAYKPDGTEPGGPGGVIVPARGSLTVELDPPARGDVLEVSAEGDRTFEIELIAEGGAPAGSVTVPAVAGPGLRARYLALPGAAGGTAIRRLIVHAPPGGAPAHLGHVFIYPDSRDPG